MTTALCILDYTPLPYSPPITPLVCVCVVDSLWVVGWAGLAGGFGS